MAGSTEGPLLMVAGTGSGKTFSVALRTLNLLLLPKTHSTVKVAETKDSVFYIENQQRTGKSYRIQGATCL